MTESPSPLGRYSADHSTLGEATPSSSPTDSNLRNRRATDTWGDLSFSNTSPTSTISSTPTRFRPLRHVHSNSSVGTPSKRIIIRSDPVMVSCFDPADKELYDLWAPKK